MNTLHQLVNHPRWPDTLRQPSGGDALWGNHSYHRLPDGRLRAESSAMLWRLDGPEMLSRPMLPDTSDRATTGILLALLLEEIDDTGVEIAPGPNGWELWREEECIGAGCYLGDGVAQALLGCWGRREHP